VAAAVASIYEQDEVDSESEDSQSPSPFTWDSYEWITYFYERGKKKPTDNRDASAEAPHSSPRDMTTSPADHDRTGSTVQDPLALGTLLNYEDAAGSHSQSSSQPSLDPNTLLYDAEAAAAMEAAGYVIDYDGFQTIRQRISVVVSFVCVILFVVMSLSLIFRTARAK
jgi:hypothetical protein